MAIDPDKLLAISISSRHCFNERDVILYALAVGYGQDPTNEAALRYCYEQGLRATPTLPIVLGHPGFWMRDLDTGIDWRSVVHGEQALELHGPVPVAGEITSETRVVDVIDKGEGRGAVVIFDREIADRATGAPIATLRQTNFCRKDGGFGGPSREMPKPIVPPDGEPDHVVILQTRPETALLYRQSADPNPLHADPLAARAAGFDRPILHGLATFGFVGHALVKALCDYDGTLLKHMAGRFTGVIYPGETLRTDIWERDGQIFFEAAVIERNAPVMGNGLAQLATN
jgi:acyl dehydratase